MGVGRIPLKRISIDNIHRSPKLKTQTLAALLDCNHINLNYVAVV
jgi:hypothetical protein